MKLGVLLVVSLALAVPSRTAAAVIDFEGFDDGEGIISQVPGVIFANAVILSAGISLNEFEFPPRSGRNVASDSGGPLSLSFSTPTQTFGAYFTYLVPLTIRAFNASEQEIDVVTSLFSSNLALSGVAGSAPNEFLLVSSSVADISRVAITGDPAGGSFTLDDAAGGNPVPEPSSWSLLFLGGGLLVYWGRSASRWRR